MNKSAKARLRINMFVFVCSSLVLAMTATVRLLPVIMNTERKDTVAGYMMGYRETWEAFESEIIWLLVVESNSHLPVLLCVYSIVINSYVLHNKFNKFG